MNSQSDSTSPVERASLRAYVDEVERRRHVSVAALTALLTTSDTDVVRYLFDRALSTVQLHYGTSVFMRGLIEISSYCRNDCRYCGIRRSRTTLHRYRLSTADILRSCEEGYAAGMRTFVLQGGEDPWFTDERLCRLVEEVASRYPDCAVTLSMGERSEESYRRLFEAGARRYLLRHETADPLHYAYLHPADMSFDHRMNCLASLKKLGYQVGCGFMVGSPGQTMETLYRDLLFVETFQPHMVGIGPFVATQDTPFADEPNGSVERTVRLVALLRLILPHALLPATTALGSLHPLGRERALRAGANVVMPNISPVSSRKLYTIYDNKICLTDGVDHCFSCLQGRVGGVGRQLVVDRGDYR